MHLSRKILSHIKHPLVSVPEVSVFDLPEKVLQFGTGVLLRGLPDYFIDKANKAGIFNGRVVMVKSTGSGNAGDADDQDQLYTHCLKGITNGRITETCVINAAVSRILSARTHWREVLDLASSPDIRIIISNTTEAGLVFDENDDSRADPPQTFPYKLFAFLKERFTQTQGDMAAGYVILPTELLVGNAEILKSLLRKIAEKEGAPEDLTRWLFQANRFCNTLVDRIVPGKLTGTARKEAEDELGYSDNQMIMSEPYGLWAIESRDPDLHSVLSFAAADPGVVIADDITRYRELKLRLLNASHSFSCAMAYLSGFDTVKQAMADSGFRNYLSRLMKQEIIPCITGHSISGPDAFAYADEVADRFSNPFLEHRWLSISVQYTRKIGERILPLLAQNRTRGLPFPDDMAKGIAAWLLFMKTELKADGRYYGKRNGDEYPVQDDASAWLSELWQGGAESLCETLFRANPFWGPEIALPAGFEDRVLYLLKNPSELFITV